MTDKKQILEATDGQMAEILKALKDVGVEEYAQYVAADGLMDIVSNTFALLAGFAILYGAWLFCKKGVSSEDDGYFVLGSVLGVIAAIWICCSFDGVLSSYVQTKEPKGYIAAQVIERLK